MAKRKSRQRAPIGRILLIIVGIALIGLLIFTIVYTILFGRSSTAAPMAETKSLIEKQQEIERDKLSGGKYTLSNPKVIINPYGNAPLTALAIFKATAGDRINITVQGKTDDVTLHHTYKCESDICRVPIYGLYANYNNKVTLASSDTTKELTIRTDKLASSIATPSGVTADKSQLDGTAFYFFTPSSNGPVVAYDINGDVRWYLNQRATWRIKRLNNGHLLLSTERLINSPYYTTGLYEMDMLGKVYTEYSLPGGYHHDWFELPSGNLLVASNDFSGGTVEDVVVEIDRQTGNVLKDKTIDLKKILPADLENNQNYANYDWFHNNSVWYDEKTNSVILSGRHQDAVVSIDYSTHQLNWILGDPTGWPDKYQKYFFTPVGDDFEWQWSQHAAMITPEGYILLFDNGNNKSKDSANYVSAVDSYSRGVMYAIDTSNMTVRQVWQYGKERGANWYSPYISDVDYLSSGHYIINSGGIVNVDGQPSNSPAGLTSGKNVKLTSDTIELVNNTAVFELELPTNTYRVEKMHIYDGSEYSYEAKAKRLGSLGETRPTKTQTNVTSNALRPITTDSEYKKHDIKLTKEPDRLVISGQFERGTKLQVILWSRTKRQLRYYNIRVSKRPYTAMCVDIWSEKERKDGITVTSYINAEGLKGSQWEIYIKIGDKIYATDRSVQF